MIRRKTNELLFKNYWTENPELHKGTSMDGGWAVWQFWKQKHRATSKEIDRLRSQLARAVEGLRFIHGMADLAKGRPTLENGGTIGAIRDHAATLLAELKAAPDSTGER